MSRLLPIHRTEVGGAAEGNCTVSCSRDGRDKYRYGWREKSWLVDQRASWKVTSQSDVTYHRRYIAYKRHFWIGVQAIIRLSLRFWQVCYVCDNCHPVLIRGGQDYRYSFKYNQQDTTLYNILYYCQCSTCFRWFLRPSSGAQNCTHSIWYMSSLLAATASGSSKQTDNNKEYCIMLHLVGYT
jgi:hypothetical protein